MQKYFIILFKEISKAYTLKYVGLISPVSCGSSIAPNIFYLYIGKLFCYLDSALIIDAKSSDR